MKPILIGLFTVSVLPLFLFADVNDDLIQASKQADTKKIMLCLQNGANPNTKAKNFKNATPLHFAVENNNIEAARLLIDSGTDINAVDDEEDSVLYYAVFCRNIDMIKLLLASGVNTNIYSKKFGSSPLHWAVYINNAEVVKMFLASGLDVNVRDSEGDTPLIWASRSTAIEAAKVLLENGAKIDAKNNQGFDVFDLAFRGEFVRLAASKMTVFTNKQMSRIISEAEIPEERFEDDNIEVNMQNSYVGARDIYFAVYNKTKSKIKINKITAYMGSKKIGSRELDKEVEGYDYDENSYNLELIDNAMASLIDGKDRVVPLRYSVEVDYIVSKKVKKLFLQKDILLTLW